MLVGVLLLLLSVCNINAGQKEKDEVWRSAVRSRLGLLTCHGFVYVYNLEWDRKRLYTTEPLFQTLTD